MKKSFLVLLATLALSGCQHEDSGWRGFYYHTGSSEDGFETQSFESEAACDEWLEEKLMISSHSESHGSCGFNCTYDDEGQYICEL